MQLQPHQFELCYEVVTKKILLDLSTAYNLFQAFAQLGTKHEAVRKKNYHIMNSEHGKSLGY